MKYQVEIALKDADVVVADWKGSEGSVDPIGSATQEILGKFEWNIKTAEGRNEYRAALREVRALLHAKYA